MQLNSILRESKKENKISSIRKCEHVGFTAQLISLNGSNEKEMIGGAIYEQ